MGHGPSRVLFAMSLARPTARMTPSPRSTRSSSSTRPATSSTAPSAKPTWQPGILSDEISRGPRLELPARVARALHRCGERARRSDVGAARAVARSRAGGVRASGDRGVAQSRVARRPLVAARERGRPGLDDRRADRARSSVRSAPTRASRRCRSAREPTSAGMLTASIDDSDGMRHPQTPLVLHESRNKGVTSPVLSCWTGGCGDQGRSSQSKGPGEDHESSVGHDYGGTPVVRPRRRTAGAIAVSCIAAAAMTLTAAVPAFAAARRPGRRDDHTADQRQ